MDTVYEERNYTLYQILGDGLGCKNCPSISPPRGLPDDMSPQLRELVAWWSDDPGSCHHLSWLFLRELMEFPWNDVSHTVAGYVNQEQYAIYRTTGRPRRFFPLGQPLSGSLTSERYSLGDMISNEEMDRRLEEGQAPDNKITEVAIHVSYAETRGQLDDFEYRSHPAFSWRSPCADPGWWRCITPLETGVLEERYIPPDEQFVVYDPLQQVMTLKWWNGPDEEMVLADLQNQQMYFVAPSRISHDASSGGRLASETPMRVQWWGDELFWVWGPI